MLDRTSLSATERLRAYIDRRIDENRARDEYGDAFIGINDDQVTEAEAEVFMLYPSKVQRIGPVWEAYCNAIGADFELRGEVDDGLFAELRQEHPFLDEAMHGGDTGHDMPYKSMASFIRFGDLFGVDHPTCVTWYWKVFFMMERREASGTL
jgi:hypothetical protein